MQRVSFMLFAWAMLIGAARAQDGSLAELQFGPIESYAIALHHAKAGDWDQHFAFGFHPDTLKEIQPLLTGDSREQFLERYKSDKIPRIVSMFEQVKDSTPRVFTYQGNTVALLKLQKSIRSTQAILMYQHEDRFVVKNSSSLNSSDLKKLEEATKEY